MGVLISPSDPNRICLVRIAINPYFLAGPGIQYCLRGDRLMKLNNKLALITGAASGIGLATAQAFAEAGAHVLLADINSETGEVAAADICDQGFKATFVHLDVTDHSSIEACKGEVLAIQPQIDVLAHVAGWGKIQPFVDNSDDFWRDVVDLNLMGVVAVTRAFLDGMIEKNSGKIIVVASDAGRVGSLGETVYSAAKGGAIAFTKGLAREMARYNINVNSVCPGPHRHTTSCRRTRKV